MNLRGYEKDARRETTCQFKPDVPARKGVGVHRFQQSFLSVPVSSNHTASIC